MEANLPPHQCTLTAIPEFEIRKSSVRIMAVAFFNLANIGDLLFMQALFSETLQGVGNCSLLLFGFGLACVVAAKSKCEQCAVV